MATKRILTYVDDLTGADIPDGKVVHIPFSVFGRSYTLDTTADGARDFNQAIERFLAAASPVKAQSGRGQTPVAPQVIREWAEANGITVNKQGRIPAAVTQAYLDAL